MSPLGADCHPELGEGGEQVGRDGLVEVSWDGPEEAG